MGRREGKQDKKGGGRGKKGMREVGEERRREGEQGEMRGSFAPTAVQKLAPMGPAGPQVSHRAPADDHGHVLCLRYVSVAPQHTPRM